MSDDTSTGGIDCCEPLCSDSADVLAYDEKFSINVAFCENHVEKWSEVGHISIQDDRSLQTEMEHE